MHATTRRLRTVTIATATAALATTALVVAPPASAFSEDPPTITGTTFSLGDATTTGARFFLSNPDPALTTTAGSVLSGNAVNVVYDAGQTPKTYQSLWYACGARNAAIANCTTEFTGPVLAGSAAGKSNGLLAATGNIGQYLRYRLNIVFTANGADVPANATSDATKDVWVVPALATTTRPSWASATPGSDVTLQLSAWSTPGGTAFGARTLTVYLCSDANAGQGADGAFATTGCTSIASAVKTTVSTNTATAVTVAVPADAAGKFLVASDLITFKAGASSFFYTARSAAAPVTAAQPTPTPTPTPTPSASATAGQNPIPTTPSAAPVQPTLSIVARNSSGRGKYLGVALTLKGKGNGTTGNGRAIVQLVKSPSATTVAATLKPITVKSLKGQRYELIPSKLKKGTYHLRVVYTDNGSRLQAAATKKVTIR